MMNAHVELFYRLLSIQAVQQGRPFAQTVFYTLAKLENDPNWSPYQ